MFKLTHIHGRHPLDHEETNRACRLSLLLGDSRTERHNSYPRLSDKRAERQQEAAIIARLRPRTGNVENIVPAAPPEPPRAA